MATKKLTRQQARAALADMPERTFARLVAEGMPRTGDGAKARFPWPEIHHWLLERERKKAREAARPADIGLAESGRREAAAKAEIAELKALEMRGQLVPAELHQQRLDDFVGGFVATVTGRLNRFERDIVQADTPAAARRVVDAMKRQLLEAGRGFADELEGEDLEEDAA